MTNEEIAAYIRQPKQFVKGDCVAIYGVRNEEYIVIFWNKDHPTEITVATWNGVYRNEWAGKFYVTKHATYEQVDEIDPEIEKSVGNYLRWMHSNSVRHEYRYNDD